MSFLNDNSLTGVTSLDLCRGAPVTFESSCGQSIIDNIIVHTNLLHHLASCEIVNDNALLYSNHRAVHCVLNFKTFPTEVTGDLVDRVIWSKISEHEKDTYRLSLENDLELQSLLLNNITCTDDIDFLYLVLVRTAMNTSNRCFSKRTYMPHLKPYWCQELTSLNKSMKICRQDWLQSGSPRIGPIFEK